jgi:integrase
MPRQRHQNGWVKLSGKKVKKWIGHWRPYREDGKRSHATIVLGLKSEMAKWQAEEKLRAHIAKEENRAPEPAKDPTFEWFWRYRFVPTRSWSDKTESLITTIFERHVLPRIGHIQLAKLDKLTIDVMLKELAKGWSSSLVHKVRVYAKAALEEAVEQGYLDKNPVRKIQNPQTRPPSKRYLSLDEIRRLLDAMGNPRDRLIVRMCIILGLRPGEIFALKWDDFDEANGRLRIDEAVVKSKIKATKTPASRAWIWLPQSITGELVKWRETSSSPLIFPARTGRPLDTLRFLRRHIQPAAVRCGIMPERPKDWPKGKQWVDGETSVNFRALRRTCATWFQRVGTAKDIQAQLRHTTPVTTLGVYVQEIPESVRAAVEALDQKLCGKTESIQ